MDDKTVNETELHWADEKEVGRSSRPLKFLFFLIRILPLPIVNLIVFPAGLFYYTFSKRARTEAKLYQEVLKEYTNGEIPKKISPYRQILSFSFSIVEKLAGWTGNINFSEIIAHDDDCPALIQDLNNKKGALFICSHLGNMELLRSLSSYGRTGCTRDVPVTVMMNMKLTTHFSETMKEINPKYAMNVIDPDDIGIDTICTLQEKIDAGEIIVIAGDRPSANVRDRIIVKDFLGKPAPFPLGVFLIALLLNAPTYYIFGIREKTAMLRPKNNIFVHKTKIDFNVPRAKRDETISNMIDEYIGYLETYCKKYPYQWYNFHNFWHLPN